MLLFFYVNDPDSMGFQYGSRRFELRFCCLVALCQCQLTVLHVVMMWRNNHINLSKLDIIILYETK